MLTYIARRLLLMIPTLLGITLLVFTLIALSPGGIGAGLLVSGGQMDAKGAAFLEAYIEDRYGLDDPVPMQYVRWLGRICPLKFGQRDQWDHSERVRRPRALRTPPCADWFAGAAAAPTSDSAAAASTAAGASAPPPGGGAAPSNPIADYRVASRRYAAERVSYSAARREFLRALADHAKAIGRKDLLSPKAIVHTSEFAAAPPPRDAVDWPRLDSAGAKMVSTYAIAMQSRSRLIAAIDAEPFPLAGVPLLPDLMWIGAPDLGNSFSKNRPVIDLLISALPVTLLINLVAFPIIYLIAVPTGMLAAARRGSWFDVLSGATFVGLWSVPVVWAGVLAIGYLANKQYLGWFPVSGLHDTHASDMAFLPSFGTTGWDRGWLLDTIWHICLPVTCLVYAGFAVLSKQTRAAMLENFNADYVRTAKAKGVPRRDVVLRHVFRNSLLPIITMFVSIFPAALAGSVVVERIFSVPGMGSLMIEAIELRDRELILANTTMIACINLLALLLADFLYAAADPRVTYE
ncbi:MAG: ABC transporter permease [Phycisphaerales bacterium]|nr:ABC transporter permease [Phycisphaerales bacterium]